MGFCMLTVHGLNKLTALGGTSKQLYKGRPNNSEQNARSSVSSLRTTNVPRMALLSGAVLLIVLFCWKTVVRNNVWSTRESLFRSGVETLPHNAKAHYNYANFLKDVGREQEAIHHYTTALDLAPDHVSAHNNLGTLLKNDEEAMKHFTEAIKYDPYHANAYFNLGSRFASLKRLSEAESMLRQALRLNPTYLDAVMNLAGVLSDAEKYSEAEELHKKALTLDPKDADAYNNYAVFLGKLGRTQESLGNYNMALKLNPSHSVSLVNMARQLRGDGNIREAEQAYKRALSIKREASTLQLLGVLYYHSERLNEAEQAWREALELEPSNIETRSNQAILFSRTNRFSKAVKILKDLVLDDPLNPGHFKTLAGLYAQNRQVIEGLQVITNGLRFHTKDADLYFHQGSLYKDLKDMEKAKKSFQKAVDLNPNHFSAHLNLGVIFHLERKYADARRHYEIAAKLDPNNATLKQNMAKLIRVEEKGES